MDKSVENNDKGKKTDSTIALNAFDLSGQMPERKITPSLHLPQLSVQHDTQTETQRNDDRSAVRRVSDSSFSWDRSILPLPDLLSSFEIQSEPVQANNLRGALHLALTARNNDSADNKRGGVFVLTSRNGEKWDRIIHVFNNNSNAIAGNVSIACDTTEIIGPNKNPFRNHLYTAWTVYSTPEASSQFSEVLFAKSVDGGNTFGVPVIEGWSTFPKRLDIRSQNSGENRPNGRLSTDQASIVSDADVNVDNHGVITVSWKETNPRDGSVSYISRSSANGGESFGPDERASN